MVSLSLFSRFWQAKTCLLCHENQQNAVCTACQHDCLTLATQAQHHCPQCGYLGNGETICGRCQHRPPPFEKMWSSFNYEAPISQILYHYKHHKQLHLAPAITQLMTNNPPPWLNGLTDVSILAMPLSRQRLLERGFNQCEEMAQRLAKHYQLPYLPSSIIQRQHSVPQSTLKGKARQSNVRNVFHIQSPVKICNVLLIDDVATTNSSLSELSRTLRQSGVERIFCWTFSQAKVKKF